MKIVICTVQTGREEWADCAIQLYLKKISAFWDLEHLMLKSPRHGRTDSGFKKEQEGQLILGALKSSDYVVLLDQVGKVQNSEQWANSLNKIFNRGPKRVCFVIGGAFGVSQAVLDRANEKWSMSDLVFNHLLAQVVLLEQLYRSYTILHKLPYHNA